MRKLLGILLIISVIAACTTPKTSQKSTTTASNASPSAEKSLTMSCRSKFLDNGTTLKVFLNLELDRLTSLGNPLATFRKDLSISYVMYPDYTSRQVLSSGVLPLNEQTTVFHNGEFVTWFEVPKPKDLYTGLVMILISDGGINKSVSNNLLVRFQSGKMGDYIAVFDKSGRFPINRNYLLAQDTIVLKDLANTNRNLTVLRYKHDFDPALPPTATSPRVVTKMMYIDSVYSLPTNIPIVLKQEALYYLCRDTTEAYGIGLMTVDKRFPRLTRPEKLAKPPVYISTSAELSDIYSSTDQKRALDRYWLGLTSGNQTAAKRSIKAYYRRVEQANKLFTTYKEGWKTDKGMVYIIMGQPDKIQQLKEKEIWTYAKRGQYQEINFTFNKRPNQFVEDHYELTRYVEYQPIWFPVVEAWRSGEVEK